MNGHWGSSLRIERQIAEFGRELVLEDVFGLEHRRDRLGFVFIGGAWALSQWLFREVPCWRPTYSARVHLLQWLHIADYQIQAVEMGWVCPKG
jgi:hypothetical protein